MKVYELTQDFQGLPKGTQLHGPYALSASHLPAYFTQDNIPSLGTEGEHGWFQSAVENNPEIFKLLPDEKAPA